MPLLQPYVGDLEKYNPVPRTDLSSLGDMANAWLAARQMKMKQLQQERDRQIMDAVIQGGEIPERDTLGSQAPSGMMGKLGEFMTGGRVSPQDMPVSDLEKSVMAAKMKPVDAGEYLDQIELMQVMNQLKNQSAGQTVMPSVPSANMGTSGTMPGRMPAHAPIPMTTPMPRKRLSLEENIPEPFIQVSEGTDKYGLPKTKTVKNPEYELYEKKQSEKIKTEAGIQEGQRAAMQNLNLVSGAFKEMSQLYADAIREGGMGSKLAQIKSGVAIWAGGGVGEKFPATAAWPGIETEIITRMMPMLTQQGDKPGSVRLVSTVFDRLRLTVPKGNTPPRSARRMMEQSLRNMYRFAKASTEIGLTNEMLEKTPDNQLPIISQQVSTLAKNIQIMGKEKQELENLINKVLGPIDELIKKNGGNIMPQKTSSRAVIMEDAQGNRALVDPATMKVLKEL